MDNDEHRDIAEELDNAMIPFRENMTKVFDAGWNVDDLLVHMLANCPTVGQDKDGFLIIYPGLTEAPDKSLWMEKER